MMRADAAQPPSPTPLAGHGGSCRKVVRAEQEVKSPGSVPCSCGYEDWLRAHRKDVA